MYKHWRLAQGTIDTHITHMQHISAAMCKSGLGSACSESRTKRIQSVVDFQACKCNCVTSFQQAAGVVIKDIYPECPVKAFELEIGSKLPVLRICQNSVREQDQILR